jgi:hypothetical protein
MGLKRHQLGSQSSISRVESLESRQLFSATLVQITIPTTTSTPPKHHKPVKPTKPAVVHKKVTTSGEEHANIGYQIFAK